MDGASSRRLGAWSLECGLTTGGVRFGPSRLVPEKLQRSGTFRHVAEVCGLWGQSAAGDDEPFVPGTTRYDAVTERLSEA